MVEPAGISVVVLTHDRPDELAHTLAKLAVLPERPTVIVVDNASVPGVVPAVTRRWPGVRLVRSDVNLGAAGRNIGVREVRTPYVAFCDDDTWWAPGALALACGLFDRHPALGVINAKVLVAPHGAEDATCRRMADSPLAQDPALPGAPLIAFMAGAVAMRAQAFREVGGYEPRLFLGAEESLMGLDMAARGWRMVYVSEVVTHHAPSSVRQVRARQVMTARNRIWTAWLRLPWRDAMGQTRLVWREAAGQGLGGPVLLAALRGLAWVGAHRAVVPRHVARMHGLVFGRRGSA